MDLASSIVRVEIHNRQRGVEIDLGRLQILATGAYPLSLSHPGCGPTHLQSLELVEVSVVSDRTIAGVHRRFLGIPGPTDVITFDHGEIIVSATTAARQAILETEAVDRELARYIVHGLLHLNGHQDAEPAEAAAMWQAQEAVLRSLWPVNA